MALSDEIRDVYQREAATWDKTRNRTLFERSWLDRALADVPPGGAVIDLGCGAGDPIGCYIDQRGFALTGVDFAPAMLALFARRLPRATAIQADMRDLDLGTTFDAIIGWDSFFHLTADAQRQALPRIARHLAPGGTLLLTVGPEAGEAIGRVGASQVYHASLSRAEYESILALEGVETRAFSPNDASAHGHTLLLARRNPC